MYCKHIKCTCLMTGLFIHNILMTDSMFVATILMFNIIVSCLYPCVQPLHLGPNQLFILRFHKDNYNLKFARVCDAAERFHEISLCIPNDVIESTKVIKDHRMSGNTYLYMSNLIVSTISAEGLAPAGARGFADRVLNTFGFVYIYVPILAG